MRAAESGVYQAQYNLGKIFRDGRGVERDAKKAAQWFLAAAKQGYAKAQNHIGVRLARGEGIAKNEVEALKWLMLSEKSGHKLAGQNRKALAESLAPEIVAKAKKLAGEWKAPK